MKKMIFCLAALIGMLGFYGVQQGAAQDAYAFNEVSFLSVETGFGARAMGLGGAFIGIADDYSAIYWNPAGLGQIKLNEMFTSLTHNSRNIETDYLRINDANSQSKTAMGSIGLVFVSDVYQGSLVFAGGYNRLHNYNSLFGYTGFNPNETFVNMEFLPPPNVPNSLNQDETIEIDGTLAQYSFGVSVEVAPDVFVGGALNYWRGHNNYSNIFFESDDRNLYFVFPDDFDYYRSESIVDTEIWGYDLKLGVLLRQSENFRLGATINSPRFIRLEENWEYDEDMYFDDGTAEYFDDTDDLGIFEYKVKLPFTFGAGASYSFLNGLISAEWQYTDWTQFAYRDDTPLDGVSKSDANRNIKRTLRSTFNPKIGLEYGFPGPDITLRVGFARYQNPVENSSSKSNRNYFSAGLGLPLGREAGLDIAYRRGWWETSTIGMSGVVVGETHTDHRIFASLSFNFQ